MKQARKAFFEKGPEKDGPQSKTDLKAKFKGQSKTGAPQVNYIWINSRKAESAADKPVCTIEMGNIKTAVENANKYPKAEFRIWVDKNLLDEYTVFCIESYIDENKKFNNIELRNLQEIPDYASDQYFVPLAPGDAGFLTEEFSRGGPRNVYSRADYARILVLDHCMKTSPDRSRIIYSDIDCTDVRLAEALRVIRKHGVAIHDYGSSCVSHGYIGLASDNAAVRSHFDELKSQTRELAHADRLGYPAFSSYLDTLGMPNNKWHDKIGLNNLLPYCGKAPEHVAYTPKRDFTAWHGTVAPTAVSAAAVAAAATAAAPASAYQIA